MAFFAFLALAGIRLQAGTFELSASVDRDHLELGESLHLSLVVTMHGQMTFAPQVEQPSFDGFAVQGQPTQSQSISNYNGDVTMQTAFVFELEAQKSGTLTLGPFHASAKDALAGTLAKVAPAIRVTVTRPKNLGFTLPSGQPTPEGGAAAAQAPPPDDSELRGIKGDRPLPWLLIGLLAAGLLGLGAWLFWWWYKPKPVKQEAVPRDPAQLALEQLERAYRGLAPGGELAFAREAAGLLRQFLRHKLALRSGVTLAEALRAVRFQAPGSMREEREALRQRLDWLLYGGVELQPADADEVYQRVRAQVIDLERIIIPPVPEPASPPPVKGAKRTRKR